MTGLNKRAALAAVAGTFFGLVRLAGAGQSLGVADVLVSNLDTGIVNEYTPGGAAVQSFTLPNPETVRRQHHP